MIGTMGAAAGNVLCGLMVHYLQSKLQWSVVDSYHLVFWVYAAMGAMKFWFSILLSEKCEHQSNDYITKESPESSFGMGPLSLGYRQVNGTDRDETESPDVQPYSSSLLPSRTSLDCLVDSRWIGTVVPLHISPRTP